MLQVLHMQQRMLFPKVMLNIYDLTSCNIYMTLISPSIILVFLFVFFVCGLISGTKIYIFNTVVPLKSEIYQDKGSLLLADIKPLARTFRVARKCAG